MAPYEEIKCLTLKPLFSFRGRQLLPGKRPPPINLTRAIHSQSIVSPSATQHIALSPRPYVLECARINQNLSAIADEANTQYISMAMSSGQSSYWPGIHDKVPSRPSIGYEKTY